MAGVTKTFIRTVLFVTHYKGTVVKNVDEITEQNVTNR